MPCQELFQMRKQASQIKNQMDQQRKKARIQGAQPRQGRPSGNSEYIPYLQRKLSRLATASNGMSLSTAARSRRSKN